MDDYLVNPLCAQKIAALNSETPSQLKFGDFAGLKTYGRDKVSRMKMADLKDLVTEFELQQIRNSVQDDNDTVKVLRWIKRGLCLNYAIRKVQVDQEISLAALCGQIQ